MKECKKEKKKGRGSIMMASLFVINTAIYLQRCYFRILY